MNKRVWLFTGLGIVLLAAGAGLFLGLRGQPAAGKTIHSLSAVQGRFIPLVQFEENF